MKTRPVTLRPYREDDIPFLVEATKRYIPQLPHYQGVRIDEDRVSFMLKTNLNNESAFWMRLLCDSHTGEIVGCGAGYCVTMLFSWQKMTSDIFLFVREEYRTLANVRTLMHAYKMWAFARGASIIAATHTSGYRSEIMDALLTRQGYTKVGSIYHLRRDEYERTLFAAGQQRSDPANGTRRPTPSRVA